MISINLEQFLLAYFKLYGPPTLIYLCFHVILFLKQIFSSYINPLFPIMHDHFHCQNCMVIRLQCQVWYDLLSTCNQFEWCIPSRCIFLHVVVKLHHVEEVWVIWLISQDVVERILLENFIYTLNMNICLRKMDIRYQKFDIHDPE